MTEPRMRQLRVSYLMSKMIGHDGECRSLGTKVRMPNNLGKVSEKGEERMTESVCRKEGLCLKEAFTYRAGAERVM